jgi:hypothetical protein
MAPTIFFIFSEYAFWMISLRPNKPEMPAYISAVGSVFREQWEWSTAQSTESRN